MKQLLISAFLIFSIECTTALTANAQLKVAEGEQISFGKIYQTGEKVHKVLTLQNTGTEEVLIRNVHTSCGCTVASVSDSQVAPGKETTVNIEFNPTGYIGEVTKYIYIMTSDPKQQMISVTMTGYVAYALQPTPNYVVFSNAKPGELDSTSVTLSNTSDEQMRITKVGLPSDKLSYKLSKEVLKPGEFTNLEIYIDSRNMGDINGTIQIYTTSKLQPMLQLKVFAGFIGR